MDTIKFLNQSKALVGKEGATEDITKSNNTPEKHLSMVVFTNIR